MGKKKRAQCEHRDQQWSISNPEFAEWLGFSSQSLAGVTVTERTALTLTALYRGVSIVAGTVAGLPLKSYRTHPDGTREQVDTFLDNPNGPGGRTPFQWAELVLVHMLLHGDAFLAHLYNGGGAIIGLEPLHPKHVSVRSVDDPWRWEYDIAVAGGGRETLTPLELTHIPALGTDGETGLGLLTVGKNAIATGLAGDQAAARMFGSGMMVAGLVSGDSTLTETQAKQLKAQLLAKMAGVDNAGGLAVVNRDLKFDKFQMTSEDAQFLESRVHQVEEIARLVGVPPHLLGQTEKSTSWGTGIEEQNRGLARYTLAPWTSRIEQALSRLLTRPTICEFDYSGLLQPSPEKEIQLLLDQIAGGLITVDEARRIRNMPPLAAPAEPEPVESETP